MDIKITQDNGISATSTGSSVSISISLPLVLATKISQGMTGKFYVGLNCHVSPPTIAAKVASLGGNTVRMTPFYRAAEMTWPPVSGTGAGEQVILQTVKEALALGFQPLLTLTNYWVSTPARWSDFVTQVVSQTAGAIYEFENEPNVHTPQAYFDGLKLTSIAMKAANPAALLAGPTTNASYVAATQTWQSQLMDIPGFWSYIDIWSTHPYNQTQETSWMNDTNSVITRVLAKKPVTKTLKFMNSEQGWVTSRTGEGAGDPYVGYSKVPFMQRASRQYTHSIFYALYDDSFGNVGCLNKLWSPIVTDSFKRVRAATDASMYVREYIGGNYNTTANWYVRTTVPGGSELICWSAAGDRDTKIVVDSPAAGFMTTRMVGGVDASFPVVQGRQVITVPLTLRARILGGNGVTFPEFAS